MTALLSPLQHVILRMVMDDVYAGMALVIPLARYHSQHNGDTIVNKEDELSRRRYRLRIGRLV